MAAIRVFLGCIGGQPMQVCSLFQACPKDTRTTVSRLKGSGALCRRSGLAELKCRQQDLRLFGS